MTSNTLFHSHKLLIYSRVHYFAKRYGLDYQELQSEAFVIFCEAVERFDPQKAKFSTFLFHRLRTLNDYCRKVLNQSEEPLSPFFPKSEDLDSPILFQQAVNSLSEDGKKVLSSLLSRDFESPKIREREQSEYQVTKQIIETWGWTRKRAVGVWNELKTWWTNYEPCFNN